MLFRVRVRPFSRSRQVRKWTRPEIVCIGLSVARQKWLIRHRRGPMQALLKRSNQHLLMVTWLSSPAPSRCWQEIGQSSLTKSRPHGDAEREKFDSVADRRVTLTVVHGCKNRVQQKAAEKCNVFGLTLTLTLKSILARCKNGLDLTISNCNVWKNDSRV